MPYMLPGGTVLLQAGYINPAITYSRADAAKTYFDINGVLQTAAANVWPDEFYPVTHAYTGHTVWPASTNELLNSAAPATQTVTLTAGTYTLWCIGSGSVTSSAGLAVGTGFGVSNGSTWNGGTLPAGGSNTFTITTAGTVVLTVAGSLTVMQCETSSFPTPYIPTTSAAVTRNIDLPTFPSTAPFWNGATGTIVVKFSLGTSTWAAAPRIFSGPINAPSYLNLSGVTLPLQLQINQYPTPGAAATTVNNVNATGANIAACAWNSSGFTVCLNGGATASLAATPTQPTTLYLGLDSNDETLNGWLDSVVSYPYAMTTEQAQYVTSPGGTSSWTY